MILLSTSTAHHGLLDHGELWGSRERDFLINMELRRCEPMAHQTKWMNDIQNRRQAA
jgi:hypothetical protein